MDKKKSKLTKFRRLSALAGLLLLLTLYIITFFAALTSSPEAQKFFIASLALTVAVPVMIYIFLWLAKKFG